MTILDRQITSKGKEDNGSSRQNNQEKGNWSQRARQNNQRNRNPIHRREQVGPSGDFSYWNNQPVPRNIRKEVSHCEPAPKHHEPARDDLSGRSHLKPKGLSKSNNNTAVNDDLLSSKAVLTKDELHSPLETSPAATAISHDVNLPTTSNSCNKIPSRAIKKSGEKKRKQRRSVPYGHTSKVSKHPVKPNSTFPTKLPQNSIEECASNVPKESIKPVCQFKPTNLVSESDAYSAMEAIYNPRHFPGKAAEFRHNVPRQDEYATIPAAMHKTSRSNSIENCRNSPDYDNKVDNEVNEARNNSDDEHDQNRLKRLNHGIDFKVLEEDFEKKLKKVRGFIIKPMVEDGACLFRAVADQIYGDQDMHDEVRKNCMNYMLKNADYYANYVTEDFNAYINRKRQLHTFGNHLEIQAMAELYNRPFEVYQYTTEPLNTFQTSHLTSNPPIRVSYHENSHYNSVVDPYKATIGVGLGLPSFKPGLVEANMVDQAMKASEDLWEQQMLNDKVVATDWETTDDAILEQVARESYMEYIDQKSSKINEVPAKQSEPKKTPPRELCCSPTAELGRKTFSPKSVVKEFPKKTNRRPPHGGSDWVAEDEEWEVLSQVLANSQQEYMDVLKQHATQSKATCSKYT